MSSHRVSTLHVVQSQPATIPTRYLLRLRRVRLQQHPGAARPMVRVSLTATQLSRKRCSVIIRSSSAVGRARQRLMTQSRPPVAMACPTALSPTPNTPASSDVVTVRVCTKVRACVVTFTLLAASWLRMQHRWTGNTRLVQVKRVLGGPNLHAVQSKICCHTRYELAAVASRQGACRA